MRLFKRLSNFFDRTLDVMVDLAGMLIIFVMLSVGIGVGLRYFFHRPIGWTIEISEYIMVYVTFMAVAWVLKKEGHVKMDLILNMLNSKTQALINTITSSVCVIISLVLTFFAGKVTLYQYKVGYTTTSLLSPPKYIFTVIIFIGSFLLFIQFLRRTYGLLRSWQAETDKSEIN